MKNTTGLFLCVTRMEAVSYERARRSGRYNMLLDCAVVMKEFNISRYAYISLMNYYRDIMEHFCVR